ncbi:hypothetical protein FRC08_002759 [Ceratobasidium sp. 394]|nr:hypothetical protein FRC08_002759 [Ceratobasidium sp. 394]
MRPAPRLLNALARPARARPYHTLGFIGLGQMGLNMADNLFTRTATAYSEGSTVESSKPPVFLVCDVNRITADTFARDVSTRFPGVLVEVAETPAEMAQRAETIFTMLPSSPQVKDVYLGERGILHGISKRPEQIDSLCVDSTTLDVDVAKDVAAQIEAVGTNMVDAPVSGGVVGARAGTLSFMVGGSDVAYKKAHPFLANMGRNIVHCGASGSGLTAKVHSLACGSRSKFTNRPNNVDLQQLGPGYPADRSCRGHVVGHESWTVACNVGWGLEHVDRYVFSHRMTPCARLTEGLGRCWSSEVNNPIPGALPGKSPPCEKDYHGGFASKLMQKDMALAQHAASTVSTPLPLGDAATAIYAAMNSQGSAEGQKFADKDFSVVYEYLRQLATKQQV